MNSLMRSNQSGFLFLNLFASVYPPCENKIYEARKNYVLNRYVDAVDMRDKNRSYQQFLGFIWQLNLREIKIIADHYKYQKP